MSLRMAFTAGGRFLSGARPRPRANNVYCAEPLREAGWWSWRRCSRDVANLAFLPLS